MGVSKSERTGGKKRRKYDITRENDNENLERC